MDSPSQEYEESFIYISGRHEHGLFREELTSYTCSGCEEYGANMGYKCDLCPKLVLHEACASLPDNYNHPLHNQHLLEFRANTRLRHNCDACGDVVRGSMFQSVSADQRIHPLRMALPDLRLHPLCMMLPPVIKYGRHKDHSLKLVVEKGKKFKCSECNQTNSCWRYRCEEAACGVILDMNCVKLDWYGLSEHGFNRCGRISLGRRAREMLATAKPFLKGGIAVAAVVIPVIASAVGG